MRDQMFEWDDEKARLNRTRHDGITFEQARLVFLDIYAIEIIDDREDYGEERVNRIGISAGLMLHVTYTMRQARRRIISARRAEHYEADAYFTGNDL